MQKRIINYLLVIALLFSCVLGVDADAKVKIKLNKKKITLTVGKSTKLKVKGTKKKAKWSSSNKKVATVSKKGKVFAKKEGKTTIKAKVAKKKLKCTVIVKGKSAVPTTAPARPTNRPVVKDKVESLEIMEDGQTVYFSLSKSAELSQKDIKVFAKKIAEGEFNNDLQIELLTTSNNKEYFVKVKNPINTNDYIRLSVDGFESKEMRVDNITSSNDAVTIFVETNNKLEENLYYDDFNGYVKVKESNLPTGIECEYDQEEDGLSIFGISKTNENFDGFIILVDELGKEFTQNIKFSYYSKDSIVANIKDSYGMTLSTDEAVTIEQDIEIYGGSGQYKVALKEDNEDVSIEEDEEDKSQYIAKIKTDKSQKIIFEITDEKNDDIKTEIEWNVLVEKGKKIAINIYDADKNIIQSGALVEAFDSNNKKQLEHCITVNNDDGSIFCFVKDDDIDLKVTDKKTGEYRYVKKVRVEKNLVLNVYFNNVYYVDVKV